MGEGEGAGGYAAIIDLSEGEARTVTGHSLKASRPDMEVRAAVSALEIIRQDMPAVLRSRSRVLEEVLQGRSINGDQRRQYLFQAARERSITFIYPQAGEMTPRDLECEKAAREQHAAARGATEKRAAERRAAKRRGTEEGNEQK